MCGRNCGRWIPVLFVLFIVGSCYTVFSMDFLLKEIESEDLNTHQHGITCAIAFNIFFGLGLISFIRTIFDDPGRVPASWVVGAEEDVEEVSQLTVRCGAARCKGGPALLLCFCPTRSPPPFALRDLHRRRVPSRRWRRNTTAPVASAARATLRCTSRTAPTFAGSSTGAS